MENGICLQLNILLRKVVAVLLGIFCLASILVFSCLPPLVHLDVLFILGIKHLQLLRGQLYVCLDTVIQGAVTAKTTICEGLSRPRITRAYLIVPGFREHGPEEEAEHSLQRIQEKAETWNILGRRNGS